MTTILAVPQFEVRDFSVWHFRSLDIFGLTILIWGYLGGDISVHKQLICLFKWLHRQAKCHASWCYTNLL